MGIKVYQDGQWKDVSQAKVRQDNAWKDVSAGFVRQDNAWKPIFSAVTPTITPSNPKVGNTLTLYRGSDLSGSYAYELKRADNALMTTNVSVVKSGTLTGATTTTTYLTSTPNDTNKYFQLEVTYLGTLYKSSIVRVVRNAPVFTTTIINQSPGFYANSSSTTALTSITKGVSFVGRWEWDNSDAYDAGSYSYTVSTNTDGQIASGSGTISGGGRTFSTSAITISTGSSATSATIEVTLSNTGGDTTASRTTTVLSISVPSAPQNLSVTPSYTTASASWTAPASDGGSAIIRYEYNLSGTGWVSNSLSTSVNFTGLSSGTSYSLSVRAVNAAGNGATADTTFTTLTMPTPGTFTYSIGNSPAAIPTTPNTPTQTRSSSTTNRIVIEWASSIPSDTAFYYQFTWGLGFSNTYTTEAGALQTTVSVVNSYNLSGTYNYPTGPYEDFWNIIQTGNISNKVQAVGNKRIARISWSSSTNASSYIVNYTISGASTPINGNYTSSPQTGSNLDIDLTGAGGTVTVNSVTSYFNADGTGTSRSGTLAGSSSVTPSAQTAMSGTVTNNWTYYTATTTTTAGTTTTAATTTAATTTAATTTAATTTAATTTAATTTAATTTTTTASATGFLCTSGDVALSICSSQGCDNSGCGSGNSCSNPQNRRGFDC